MRLMLAALSVAPRRAQALSPTLVFSVRHGGEVIVAVEVRIDGRRDGRAFLLGGNQHAFDLLAGGRGDRAGQQLVGGRGRRGKAEDDETGDARQQLSSYLSHGVSPSHWSYSPPPAGRRTG